MSTVKLADVARAAGVSQGTVSNVFNRPDLVSPDMKERVEAAARALGYRGPDPRGRLLRAGRVNALGFVSSDRLKNFFEDGYSRRFMAGIAEECEHYGAGLSLVSALSGETAAWNIRTAVVDGFVLNCVDEGNRLVELAVRRGLPFVAVEHPTDPRFDVVAADDRLGGRLAADHLVELGHWRFAVLALEFADDDTTGLVSEQRIARRGYAATRNRLHGYRDALSAAGIPAEDVPVYETFNDLETTSAGVDALLTLKPDLTALLCMSDAMASAAIRRLAHHGRRVPEDVSVVGFDDQDEAQLIRPALTTVRQPIEEKGREAVRLIFNPRRGDEPGRSVLMPVELVRRQSTAHPP